MFIIIDKCLRYFLCPLPYEHEVYIANLVNDELHFISKISKFIIKRHEEITYMSN